MMLNTEQKRNNIIYRKEDRETWWWNEEVQESIKENKEAKKAWDKIRDKNTKKIYKEKKSKAKKAVATAKEARMTICMLDWKQKNVKKSCQNWLDRETEQGKMYST